MSNWAGKLDSMCLCKKSTELLVTARSRILLPIGRLALFKAEEPRSRLAFLDSRSPRTASTQSSDGSESTPARQQLETQDEEPCIDSRPN